MIVPGGPTSDYYKFSHTHTKTKKEKRKFLRVKGRPLSSTEKAPTNVMYNK